MSQRLFRRSYFGCALFALCVFGAQEARAAEPDYLYPTRPIRIIIGVTPGGGPDVTARLVGQKLTETWKQPVVVDSRPGAGGTLAAPIVVRANPDGYTLLSVSTAHAVAPAIYSRLPYDTFKDFAGISQTARSKFLLVTTPALAVRSVKELVTLAKAKPGSLNYASAGVGSSTHFAAAIFASKAGIDTVHVPYKGVPESLVDTVAGRIQFFMAPLATAVNLVREGRLTPLGVSSRGRDALLPDVPTIAEAGVPGYDAALWFGLLTGSSVPRPIIAKLNREIVRILRAPTLAAEWAPTGLEPFPSSPEAFDRLISEESALYTQIARSTGIRAQ